MIRIVKLTFIPEKTNEAIKLLKENHEKVREMPGVLSLEIIQDFVMPQIIITLSHWTNQEALESYRQSDFFKSFWQKLKPMFAEQAQVNSCEKLF
ncbi:MAG: antibiotic biosynthesis monooxygenase [Chitinophagales bacterium]|jgi:quinol monooxygenase YgiN|nr:antibiotic biosynthesis monooxygenase [Chitinophagales bacterium]